MSRFYRVNCHDCSFDKLCRDSDKAQHLHKSHEGDTGHIITIKGPFYEAKGNTKWECVVCGFKHSYPEPIQEHIREEHSPENVYLRKTNDIINNE